MPSFIFFTLALAATVLAKPLPEWRSRGHRETASNEIGVVEIKAHGPVDRLNGVITQMHGQANEVAFEKEGMVVTIDGSERLIGRLDVLPRNCLSISCKLMARKDPEKCSKTRKTFLPWTCMDRVECVWWKRKFFPWDCEGFWRENERDHEGQR